MDVSEWERWGDQQERDQRVVIILKASPGKVSWVNSFLPSSVPPLLPSPPLSLYNPLVQGTTVPVKNRVNKYSLDHVKQTVFWGPRIQVCCCFVSFFNDPVQSCLQSETGT